MTLAGQIPLNTWGESGELNTAQEDLRFDVPTIEGEMASLDLNDLVPEATLTLQTRFSF